MLFIFSILKTTRGKDGTENTERERERNTSEVIKESPSLCPLCSLWLINSSHLSQWLSGKLQQRF